MELNRDNTAPNAKTGLSSPLAKRLVAFYFAALFAILLYGDLVRDHQWRGFDVAWVLLSLFSVVSMIRPPSRTDLVLWALGILLWTLGDIEYSEISDPPFEDRIRTMYKSETIQLTSLGFTHRFFEGEKVSTLRMFLILPAIIYFMMWRDRAVFTRYGATKLILGSPIFAAEDKTAFACADNLGVKFRTAFKDGTLLESQAYGDDSRTGPTIVRHCFKGHSINYTWEQHKSWVERLETGTNPVIRDVSFHAWVELALKSSADMKTHI